MIIRTFASLTCDEENGEGIFYFTCNCGHNTMKRRFIDMTEPRKFYCPRCGRYLGFIDQQRSS